MSSKIQVFVLLCLCFIEFGWNMVGISEFSLTIWENWSWMEHLFFSWSFEAPSKASTNSTAWDIRSPVWKFGLTDSHNMSQQ